MGIQQPSRPRPAGLSAAGFSLIELLLVVAIILIIAAIAIPNLLRARTSANESSAASSIRQIITAEVSYSTAYPTQGYANTLANLGGPATGCTASVSTGCIIDSVLTTGQKSGYTFIAPGFSSSGGANDSFVAGGAPQSYGGTGIHNFCITIDGVLRIAVGGAGVPPPPDVATCATYAAVQ
jgi:prepilin-type N-terminal cleavage/methylation domain-containing protein